MFTYSFLGNRAFLQFDIRRCLPPYPFPYQICGSLLLLHMFTLNIYSARGRRSARSEAAAR